MNKIEEEGRNYACTLFDYFKTDLPLDVLVTVETSRDKRKEPLLSWFQMDMDAVAFVIFLACNHEKHTFVETCSSYKTFIFALDCKCPLFAGVKADYCFGSRHSDAFYCVKVAVLLYSGDGQ